MRNNMCELTIILVSWVQCSHLHTKRADKNRTNHLVRKYYFMRVLLGVTVY